jgi:hypothetical protein
MAGSVATKSGKKLAMRSPGDHEPAGGAPCDGPCALRGNVWTDVADPTSLLVSMNRVGHICPGVSRLGRLAFHVVAPAAVFVAAFYLGLMLVR